MKKKGLKNIIIAIGMMLLMASFVSAKSLYVISDINANPIPIQAYDIQGSPTYLAYQYTSTIPDRNGGAVGLTIDSVCFKSGAFVRSDMNCLLTTVFPSSLLNNFVERSPSITVCDKTKMRKIPAVPIPCKLQGKI